MAISPRCSVEASWCFAPNMHLNLLPSHHCSSELSPPYVPSALHLKFHTFPGHHSMQTCSVKPFQIKEVNLKSSQKTRETAQENLRVAAHKNPPHQAASAD